MQSVGTNILGKVLPQGCKLLSGERKTRNRILRLTFNSVKSGSFYVSWQQTSHTPKGSRSDLPPLELVQFHVKCSSLRHLVSILTTHYIYISSFSKMFPVYQRRYHPVARDVSWQASIRKHSSWLTLFLSINIDSMNYR